MSTRASKQAPVPTRPRLATVKAESRRSGIPYTTYRDLIQRGEIPLVRVGKAWYVEPADTDRWIEAHKESLELGR